MKIAIQGIKGSFHHQAAGAFFQNEPLELVECNTFRDVFNAVSSGQAERGIVAIENSLHGSINPVYRLLADQGLWVYGEIRLKIELFLCGHEGADLELLNTPTSKVFSQNEAFSQCEEWLSTNLPKAQKQEMSDTAQALQYVLAHDKKQIVAVAGKQACELYEGSVLAGPINDDQENYTRFIILTKDQIIDELANRTSIIMTQTRQDQLGNLYEALRVFKERKINLSKLDSHPLPGTERQYSFYVDFDENCNSAMGRAAINELAEHGWEVNILGCYRIQETQA